MKCAPVIGHLAAFLHRDASIDEVLATKNVILSSIQDDMIGNKKSNYTQRIVFVSEHGGAPNQLPKSVGSDGDSTKPINSSTSIIIAIALLAIVLVAALFLLAIRKRKMKNRLEIEGHLKDEEISASIFGQTARMSIADQELAGENYSLRGVSDYDITTSFHYETSSAVSDIPSKDAMSIHSDEDIQSITNCSHEPDRRNVQNSDAVDESDPGGNGGVNFVLISSSDDDLLAHDETGTANSSDESDRPSELHSDDVDQSETVGNGGVDFVLIPSSDDDLIAHNETIVC